MTKQEVQERLEDITEYLNRDISASQRKIFTEMQAEMQKKLGEFDND